LLSPARLTHCIDQVCDELKVSERRIYRVLSQHRSTQRYVPRGRTDEARLVTDLIEFTRQYGRYGYRPIAALLRDAGWQVNDKRIERLWRCSAPNTLCLVSMPYGSYATEEIAVTNALKLMKESGVDAAKLQGGPEMFNIIKAVADAVSIFTFSIGLDQLEHVSF